MSVIDPFVAWGGVLASVDDALDADVVALVRNRVAVTLGDGTPGAGDARERLVEQFVVDVASMPAEVKSAAFAELGDRAFPFAQVCYVTDMDARLRAAWRQLFTRELDMPAVAAPGDLWTSLEAFMRTVARMDALDPLTTEIVRLRGARAHQCRLCQSIRSVRAANAGADETVYDAIDRYENSALEERHKVALRLVDAFVWQPVAYPPELASQVARSFSYDETVEIVFDIVRNAANKIAVLFEADAPHVTDGVEFYDVDAAGDLVYGVTPVQ
jgi:alkylhydroperoxidase family enzyme